MWVAFSFFGLSPNFSNSLISLFRHCPSTRADKFLICDSFSIFVIGVVAFYRAHRGLRKICTMKKLFKIALAVLALLLAVLIIAPVALKGKIGDIVKREANKMLSAELNFEELDISLLRRFPRASIDLKGLTLIGVERFEGDTILSAERISVAVNVASLFSDEGFVISKVLLREPSIYAHVLEDGAVNWDIMRLADEPDAESVEELEVQEQSDSEPSTFALQLKAFDIERARLCYNDEQTATFFALSPLDLSLSGDMSAEQTTLDLNMRVAGITMRSEGESLMSGVEASLDAKIAADLLANRFTLSDNTLTINNIGLSLDGWVELRDEALAMDIKANTSHIEFRDLLSMVPALYTRDFEDLTASGDMSLVAWARGEMRGDTLPAFDVALSVRDGAFKYAALPQGVEKINIAAEVKNDGGTLDATTLSLSNLSLAFAGNTLSASLQAKTPISDLQFSASALGKVDLGAVKEVYPLGDDVALNGVVTLDVKASGAISAITSERYESINASGSISIEQMSANIEGLPAVEIERAAATITPKAMTLSELNLMVGNSDLRAKGSLSNYLAYLLRDEQLRGRLEITSSLIDANALLGTLPEETEGAADEEKPAVESGEPDNEGFAIPKNLDLALQCKVGRILFQKMVIDDFSGAVSLKGGVASIDRFTAKALGGTLTAAPASFDTSNPEKSVLSLSCSIKDASFAESFRQLDMIRQIVPIFEKTGGNYSLSLDLATDMGADLSPILNSIDAKGVITSQNIDLQNIEILGMLANSVGDNRLKNLDVKDMRISFTILNGKVTTKPFDVKMGNATLSLSGTTGLDQTIDYEGRATLPASATKGAVSTIGFNIGGTFSSPKIKLGVEEVAKEALTNVVTEQLKRTTGSESLDEEFERQATNIRNEAQRAGEKLVAEAQKQRDNLVSKAKNPIAKIAAEKSGDVLVKEAEKQAAKLVAEADKQIECLRQKMQGDKK